MIEGGEEDRATPDAAQHRPGPGPRLPGGGALGERAESREARRGQRLDQCQAEERHGEKHEWAVLDSNQ